MPRKPKAGQSEPPLPLDYMLAVMADEDACPARRDEMARMAAPYLHAKADAAKARRKTKANNGEDGGDDSDADPIIRSARTTLQRKLTRLAAAEPASRPDRQSDE